MSKTIGGNQLCARVAQNSDARLRIVIKIVWSVWSLGYAPQYVLCNIYCITKKKKYAVSCANYDDGSACKWWCLIWNVSIYYLLVCNICFVITPAPIVIFHVLGAHCGKNVWNIYFIIYRFRFGNNYSIVRICQLRIQVCEMWLSLMVDDFKKYINVHNTFGIKVQRKLRTNEE